MRCIRLNFVRFLILIAPISLFGQDKITFQLTQELPEKIEIETSHLSKKSVELQAQKIITKLMNSGYLLASLDSLNYKNDTAFASVYTGKPFQWGEVKYKYLPIAMVKQFGLDNALQGVIKIEQFTKSMTKTIKHFENRGYPFAYFYWDSLMVNKDTIQGSLRFEKNILVKFDTLALYGDPGITKKFLYNYLGFKPGQDYDESIVTDLYSKMSRLPFATLLARPQVYFIGQKAIILLNLKKRKMDRMDGIIGFAPNTGTPDNSKLLVTGEFHLDFKNIKGSGKGFKLDWQSFQARSQSLNAGINLPYILNQPFGIEVTADLLKYDTIYTETRYNIGGQYLFSGLNNIKIYFEQKNTNLQSVDTVAIRNSQSLSQLTSMKTNRYGIVLQTNSFDNRLSPTRGWLFDLNASIFRRNITKDDQINRVKFYNNSENLYYTVYDSVEMSSTQFMFQYQIAKAFLIRKRIVLYNELKGFNFISPQVYFNELYRFGGNSTFRGFNEQSLFASTLSIINLEVRYLLSENSFLKIFGNGAYYMDKSERQGKISEDFPYGFGAGINLETGGGIFNISVALGKSKFIPIDFKNTKIHFGLVNYF